MGKENRKLLSFFLFSTSFFLFCILSFGISIFGTQIHNKYKDAKDVIRFFIILVLVSFSFIFIIKRGAKYRWRYHKMCFQKRIILALGLLYRFPYNLTVTNTHKTFLSCRFWFWYRTQGYSQGYATTNVLLFCYQTNKTKIHLNILSRALFAGVIFFIFVTKKD